MAGMNDSKRPLPNGWRWVKLGEVCTTTSGGTPSRAIPAYYGGDIPWVKSGELNDTTVYDTEETITEKALQESNAKVFPAGTLLVALYGATVGKLGVLGVNAATNQAVCAIFTREETVRDYLFYFLLNYRSILLRDSFGGAQPNISQSVVRNIPIPLPPVGEQKRIAAILNERLATVDRARAAAQAQLEAAQALPAAYLRAVFDRAEAQKWPTRRLGDVGEIGSGITLGRKCFNSKTRPVSYLRVANVKDGYLDLSDVYNIEATEAEIEKCRLRFGDLLLTEGGDPDKLGRGTFWEDQIPECIHQNHIYRVRFDLSMFSPQFIAAQISSQYGKSYFLSHAKRTTGIATINQKVLAGFPLMTPPFAEQQHIAEMLASQVASGERVGRILQAQLDLISRLPAVLLRQAFNGEL
jgi:type I restriction enzyme S subunit